MPVASPQAARLARLIRPPVVGGQATPVGPQLAQPVANPGARGQNMRYFLGNLTKLPNGDYTDGVYTYDSNGLSRDRPDSPVGGLPPADWGDRWDVWRAPSIGGPAMSQGPSAPAMPPGMPPFATSPSFLPGLTASPQSVGLAQSPAALISSIMERIPRPGPSPGLLERLPPEDAAGIPPGERISWQGAPSLAELLQLAMARGPGRRGML